MPQSLSKLYVHVIFSTKNREPWMHPSLRPPVWKYIAKVINARKCHAIIVGGHHDHLHALVDLHRTVCVSDLIKEMKVESSKWIKREHQLHGFAWQTGYGAFGVSASNQKEVRAYIENQEEHHKTKSFQEEYRVFLRRHDVEWDERYVWD